MSVTCNRCGAELDSAPDGPCPECGESVRRIESVHSVAYEVLEGISAAQSVGFEVVRHWTNLLDTAERLFGAGEYAVAVVVAQTATEVICERAMRRSFDAKSVPELEKWVLPQRMSFCLDNERTRKLYNELANDDIAVAGQQVGWWQPFKVLVAHRNQSVHSGRSVAESDARRGLDAARQLVQHLERHNGLG